MMSKKDNVTRWPMMFFFKGSLVSIVFNPLAVNAWNFRDGKVSRNAITLDRLCVGMDKYNYTKCLTSNISSLPTTARPNNELTKTPTTRPYGRLLWKCTENSVIPKTDFKWMPLFSFWGNIFINAFNGDEGVIFQCKKCVPKLSIKALPYSAITEYYFWLFLWIKFSSVVL